MHRHRIVHNETWGDFGGLDHGPNERVALHERTLPDRLNSNYNSCRAASELVWIISSRFSVSNHWMLTGVARHSAPLI
jgi:hypothetical protein